MTWKIRGCPHGFETIDPKIDPTFETDVNSVGKMRNIEKTRGFYRSEDGVHSRHVHCLIETSETMEGTCDSSM